MINQPSLSRQSPPLGDLSTKRLAQLLFGWWQVDEVPELLTGRGANLDDVRTELRRRESLGVGVQL